MLLNDDISTPMTAAAIKSIRLEKNGWTGWKDQLSIKGSQGEEQPSYDKAGRQFLSKYCGMDSVEIKGRIQAKKKGKGEKTEGKVIENVTFPCLSSLSSSWPLAS